MFYVYLDFNNDGEVFYVGKGLIERCKYKKRNYLHDIVCQEEGFNRAIVFESENEQECFDKEIELIKEYHTFFKDPLRSENACNFALGGGGASGYKHTDESKARMSEILKISMLGNTNGSHRKITPELRQTLSETSSAYTQRRLADGTHPWQASTALNSQPSAITNATPILNNDASRVNV